MLIFIWFLNYAFWGCVCVWGNQDIFRLHNLIIECKSRVILYIAKFKNISFNSVVVYVQSMLVKFLWFWDFRQTRHSTMNTHARFPRVILAILRALKFLWRSNTKTLIAMLSQDRSRRSIHCESTLQIVTLQLLILYY